MRGSYPVSWLILSAMMLTSQFVGVYCGSYWHTILEPSGHSKALRLALDVMLKPPRKPPDPPLRTVHLQVEQMPPDNSNKRLLCVNNHLYTVHKSCSKQRGALVDRGANGGLAGGDTRILTQHPSRKVDIQGIDNHRVNDIPIVTAAGVVDTQKGPLVLIMNQYAGISSGQTIHSSVQLEAHGVEVDDRAVKNGGLQRILLQGGYVVPLQIRGGLPYMDMRPPSDSELHGSSRLPQAILTSDLEWDPKSIDHEHTAEAWHDVASHEVSLGYDAPFTDDGEYVHTHPLAVTNLDLLIDPIFTPDIIDDPHAFVE